MRNPFLLTALVAAISGCTSPPKTTQVQADAWVDQQIAESASAISLAQRRLHQTSTASPPVAVTNKTPPASAVVVTTPKPGAPPLKISSASPPVATQGRTPVTTATPPPAAKPAVPIAALPKSNPAPIATSTKDFASSAKPPAPVTAAAAPSKPPSTPVTPPAPPPPPLPTWTASVGSTLHKSVAEWCERAKVKLIWKPVDLDYPIEAPLTFKGTFEQAIGQLFPLYDGAPRSFIVDGNSSQGILNVSERKK
jgi:type IV pili sensor histidine kinase/response regulator